MQTRLMVLFVVLLSAAVAASARQSQPCPKVTISYQDSLTGTDNVRTFHAQLVDAIPGKTVYFNWSGPFGDYLTENGLPSITIRPRRSIEEMATRDRAVYVDVLGEGIPKGCVVRDYRLVGIKGQSLASPYDDIFHDLPAGQETLHLETFVNELKAEPGSRAFVVIEGMTGGDASALDDHLQKVRWFLTDQRGIAPDRVVVVAGRPSDYPAVMLWVVPAGANLPDPYADPFEWLAPADEKSQ